MLLKDYIHQIELVALERPEFVKQGVWTEPYRESVYLLLIERISLEQTGYREVRAIIEANVVPTKRTCSRVGRLFHLAYPGLN